MHYEIRLSGQFRLVRRKAAENHLLITLLSFAASVSLVRLFLGLTGYPQIGAGELHIAHLLWGGLLLFAAALLPLLLANRWVYAVGALLAGIGVGLFIDEVGKFITQHNDYFYSPAAPIIYVFFLFTILLLLNVRRLFSANTLPELSGALEDIQALVEDNLTPREYASLASRLHLLANSTSDRYADLARALLRFVETEPLPPAPVQADLWSANRRVTRGFLRIVPHDGLRIILTIGVLAIGLLNLKNPAHVLLGSWLPAGVDTCSALPWAGKFNPRQRPFGLRSESSLS
jgi:hypothetical protein